MSRVDNKKECMECAGNPTSHWVSRVSAVMAYAMRPVDILLGSIMNTIEPFINKIFNPLVPKLCSFLASVNLGQIYDKPLEKDPWRIICLYEAANKKGISMRKFCFSKNSIGVYFATHHNGKSRMVCCFDDLPKPNAPTSQALWWMDDKGLMRKKFAKVGIPVAYGGVALTKKAGLKIFRSLDKPVITKPNLGSRSRHTTTHINTEDEFLKAFDIAKQLSPLVVIEEELKGMVFRGTIINGKVAAVIRREPPHVIGDGSSTVLELMNTANENPKRRGPIFHKIEQGREAEDNLKFQNLNWYSVPGNGRMVTLGQKVGRTNGASTTDVTDIVHPDNKKLLEKVYAVIKDPLIGVDFIIEDIAKPWANQMKCGVIECNSMPFIDLHHYPLFGESQNVAGKLWDAVFPS